MIDASPLVSVIIPCYNASKYLKASLDSVLQQTYPNLEIILINDGSTDDTEDIIRSYQDARIKFFFQKNKGQCAASNLGIKQSSGDYIKFLDADDLMNPEHIAFQVQKLQGSSMSVASCEWGRFYDVNPTSAIFKPEPVWKDMESMAWLRVALKQKYDMMGAWLWLIPRPLIQKAGGWDERLSLNNDFEFSIRLLLKADKVLFANGAKVYYRSGLKDALSQTASEKKFKDALLSTDLGCKYLLDADTSDEMRLICANRYQEWLYRIYPHYPELVKSLENKIRELGGSDRKMDGGKVSKFLAGTLGWKNSKKLKMFLQKLGYKKLPFN